MGLNSEKRVTVRTAFTGPLFLTAFAGTLLLTAFAGPLVMLLTVFAGPLVVLLTASAGTSLNHMTPWAFLAANFSLSVMACRASGRLCLET